MLKIENWSSTILQKYLYNKLLTATIITQMKVSANSGITGLLKKLKTGNRLFFYLNINNTNQYSPKVF